MPLKDSVHNPTSTIEKGLNITSPSRRHHINYSEAHNLKQPTVQHPAEMHLHSLSATREPERDTSPLKVQTPRSYEPSHTVMNDFAIYMARWELVTSGMIKFDDRPDKYWGWKSTFTNAIHGLRLTCNDELDLLAKWLGPWSSEQVMGIRAVHVSDPEADLKTTWSHLEECYGSPETIEKALLDKLERFPGIANEDPLKLR